MIPLEMVSRIRPRAGQVAVRRIERQLHAGRILLPESYTQRTRSAAAVVLAVGEGVTLPGVVPDAVVLVAVGAGRELRFGGRDEVAITFVHAGGLLLLLDSEPESQAVTHRHPLDGVLPATFETLRDGVEVRWDEGDSHGLR